MTQQTNNQLFEITKIAIKKLADLHNQLTHDEYLYLLRESVVEIANDMGVEISMKELENLLSTRE